MGGIRGNAGMVVGGGIGSVVGAGLGSIVGGSVGSVVGAGLGSVVGGSVGSGKGSGLGSVVGGLGSASGGVGSLVSWSLPANASETILSLQQVNIPAVLLAIYRITNTGVANSRGGSVVVQTDNGPFDLAPGASIDISTQTITIRSGDKPAHGTYQLLSNASVGNRGT